MAHTNAKDSQRPRATKRSTEAFAIATRPGVCETSKRSQRSRNPFPQCSHRTPIFQGATRRWTGRGRRPGNRQRPSTAAENFRGRNFLSEKSLLPILGLSTTSRALRASASAATARQPKITRGGQVDVFADSPLLVIFLVSVAALSAASEIGHRLGLRVAGEANVLTLEAAMLGLLALMLSFTFAMAVTRFDARRDAVLKEANAIGTAALRARLLPAPHDAESLRLLRDYVQIRLDVAKRAPARPELDAAIAQSNAIQERLWLQVRSAAAKDNGMVPTGLYIQALNEMFDDQESRLTAFRNRVPNIVLWALYGIAVVGIGYAGYASGIEKRRWRLPVYAMNLLAASVILLIQDIDRPTSGFISVSHQPMVDTANAVAGYWMEFENAAPRP